MTGHLGLPLPTELFGFKYALDSSPQHIYDTTYRPSAINDPELITLINEFSKSPELIEKLQRTYWVGCSGGPIHMSAMVAWFIWFANWTGVDNARKKLLDFIESETHDVYIALWVQGVVVSEPLQLMEGITIVPIEQMPHSVAKAQFEAQTWGLNHNPMGPVLPKAAIVRRHSETPELASGLPLPINRAEVNSIYVRLRDVALLINALPQAKCVGHIETGYVPDGVPPGPFGGYGYGSNYVDVVTMDVRHLGIDQAPLISSLLSSFEKKNEKEKIRLRLILERISQAKRRKNLSDKMLDLGLALEMLLLDDNTKDMELSQKFKLRGSWLLGRDSTERMEIWDLLNQIYKARSEVAHTGELCDGKQAKIQVLQEKVPAFETLAERLIRKIILDGRPKDWTRLILND